MLPANWNKMTADEKFQARLSLWLSTEGKPFATPEAAKAYQERAQRYADVVQLKEPDRVPRTLIMGDFPAHYAGVTIGDMFYNPAKIVECNVKLLRDFDLDYQTGGSNLPGKAFDRMDYKTYRWPGNQLQVSQGFQYIEGEYMTADEYDAFIADPEAFCLRIYMPRVFGALGGFQALPALYASTEIAFLPALLAPFGLPPVQEGLKALMEAGQATLEFMGATAQVGAVGLGEMGLPGTAGGFSKAPFDFIGDTLRGTRAIMKDLYRYPNKVLAACDAMVPLAIQMAVNAANMTGCPFVMLPLHKGADGFMSNDQFAKFYWPSFKAVLDGLIAEGLVPSLFVEGGYNQRLAYIAEAGVTPGRSIWTFDQTDMAQAKKFFGSWACIGGNVPASLFMSGTDEEMSTYIQKLMDVCMPGGGFFISNGAVMDNAKAELVHTYLKVSKECGVY
ncbi:MAG TPA: uroporphyrinogen decarboxylase family protein [Anaerolineaceae bacterium]